jgi:metal-responsive CopG/Arc/MetJ family transcriptional regulator
MVRVRTSITLPAELLKEIGQVDPNRSAFIERALRAYLARLRQTKDVRIINAHAGRLSEEATDVLGYQRRQYRATKTLH